MMATETGDETLRYLVDKYISKPAKNEKEMQRKHDKRENGNSHYKNDEDDDSEDEGYIIRKSELVIDQTTKFIEGFLDEARKTKIQQQMILEQQ